MNDIESKKALISNLAMFLRGKFAEYKQYADITVSVRELPRGLWIVQVRLDAELIAEKTVDEAIECLCTVIATIVDEQGEANPTPLREILCTTFGHIE